jgi:hypothetical protein
MVFDQACNVGGGPWCAGFDAAMIGIDDRLGHDFFA